MTTDHTQAVAVEPLLTLREVGAILNLSRTFVYKLMRDGHLPFVQFGEDRRIRPADLRRLMQVGAPAAGVKGRKSDKPGSPKAAQVAA